MASDPVITFETGSTGLPGIPGVSFSGGDATFVHDDFGSQVFGNLNGSSYLDIYFDQAQQAVGAYIIYGGTITEIAYDQNNNIIETATATAGYPAPFLALGEPTAQIYRVQWRYATPAYFAVDNVIYGAANGLAGMPNIPRGLTAVRQGVQVVLGWAAAEGATFYNVKRATNINGPYTTIANYVPVTGYIDQNVTSGGIYYYVVTGGNIGGESGLSQPAVAYVVDHFAFASISAPQTSAVPFVVSISACDSSGAVLTNFNGAANLSAAGEHGDAPLTPATTATFQNGQWTGTVTIASSSPDTNMRLTCSSNGVSGVSNPFNVVPPGIQLFNLSASDLVYDPLAKRIYATVSAASATYSNRLVVIEPSLGRIETSYYLGDDPNKIALSGDGHFVYIGFNGANVFRRFDLTTRAVDLEANLGYDAYYTWLQYHVQDLAALPGNPHSVAVVALAYGYDTEVVIFDDAVARTNILLKVLADHQGAVAAVSASRLCGSAPFVRMNLDASGVASYDVPTSPVGLNHDIKYNGGLIFEGTGAIFEPETMAVRGNLPSCVIVEPDMASGRAFTMNSQPVFARPDLWTLYACDPQGLVAVASLPLPDMLGGPLSLVRWGTNGLALCTSQNQLFLVRSSLVPTGYPADLSVSMSDSPHPVTLNGALTYTIQITNRGPNEAQSVALTDVAPLGASFVSASSTSGVCTWSNGVLNCVFGTLSNQAAATVTLVVSPKFIGPLTNRVVLASPSFDPSITNNSAVTVTPCQNAPFAVTQEAWIQPSNTVILNGMGVPNGLASTAWFEWGARGNFDQSTAPVTLGAGSAALRVSASVGGLSNRVVYQSRLVVSNEWGTARGAVQLFSSGRKIAGWGDDSSGQTDIPLGLTNSVRLAAGRYHSVALRSDGTVVVWGANNYGQTNVPAGLTGVVSISAGDSFSVALRNDGTVSAWGQNYAGATNVPWWQNGLIAVAGGQGHVLALKADGTMIAWGDNSSGQSSIPAGLSNVVAVAAGSGHNLAMKADGTVVSWGYNGSGQTNVPVGLTNAVAVAAGAFHSLALRSDGTMIAWGEDSFGQCDVPPGLSNVVAIAAGFRHSLALKSDGTIIGWGLGQGSPPPVGGNASLLAGGVSHSLADGENIAPQASSQTISWPANQDLPVTLRGADLNGDALNYRITLLPALGTLYQFENGVRGAAITSPETPVTDPGHRVIYASGVNASGKPYSSFGFKANDGETDSFPATVSLNIGSVYVHTQPPAVTAPDTVLLNGMVLANGLDSTAWFEWGERGAYAHVTDAVDAGNSSGVFRVTQAVGGFQPRTVYQCRLVVSNAIGLLYGAPKLFSVGGKVSAWGNNWYGQTNVPSGLSNAVAVTAGDYTSYALRSDGKVVVWGNNWYRQTNVPATLSNVIAIAGGFQHALALRNDGSVVAWGSQTSVPATSSNVIAVAGGGAHSLALRSDGTVVAWGNNTSHQCDVPVGLSNVIAVSAGNTHSLALKADGSIAVWGNSAYSQPSVAQTFSNVTKVTTEFNFNLGLSSDGTVLPWGLDSGWGLGNIPAALSNAVDIAAGGYLSLGLKSDGTLMAWGGNNYGQSTVPSGLGDVSTMAGGWWHGLAIGGNLPPQVTSIQAAGPANRDLVVTLNGYDPNGDPLTYQVTSLPLAGTLFQYANGARGAQIGAAATTIADAGRRLIYAPPLNGHGSPYVSFGFSANDGEADSNAGTVNVSIAPPLRPSLTGTTWQSAGVLQLNFTGDSNTAYSVWASGDLVNWFILGPADSLGNGQFQFIDSATINAPQRFYRAGSFP